MSEEYRCEALGAQHDRRSFACGVAELDRYFHQQVTQDIRRRMTSCFVAVAVNSGAIAGYDTLASAGIPVSELPVDLLRRLPRYPTLPAVRIGRLAVDGAFRRRGLGELLLMDAAARADRAEQANYALLVDAKDDAAVDFYRRYGFTAYASNPRILFLPLATATSLLEAPSRKT
ncbi:MAG TPA: GNAT family N-acetyltransferase [Stellaceae bacterium]|nr:GNAT family N-acetyltransferase [Stellaceae bacterium]